ncbi:MAG: hypothetical protein RL308_2230 [Bacteroidota bacterium]|jgi:hypothetical protein
MDNFYDQAEKVLKRIDDQVTLIVANLKMGGILDPENIIFNSREIMQALDVSKRTLQEWRDKNIIGFAKVNGKFYYKLSDIQNLINDNYTPKK